MFGESIRHHWLLDPEFTFLNHGSFGACPRPILEAQSRYREALERQPLRFFLREYDELLGKAREVLAEFLGADSGSLAFVTNATTGVNTVLRGLDLSPGDELLTTNHGYGACTRAAEFVAARAGAKAIVAHLPWPVQSDDEVVASILNAVTPRTRIALIDHITSPTGLVLPIGRIVSALHARNVEVLVDGAHAPGQVPLDLDGLGAAWYTGNCHKWLCAPKGCAFLYVREDKVHDCRPLVISHGAGMEHSSTPRFRREFDWQGTHDPSPFLTLPHAIQFMGELSPNGIGGVMSRNRELALSARRLLCETLDVPPPAPESMVGSLAAVPLGKAAPPILAEVLATDPLQDALYDAGIEVPVVRFPTQEDLLIRVSAQVYNTMSDYQHLGNLLYKMLAHQAHH
jgi:isopenicillin-N epimerase